MKLAFLGFSNAADACISDHAARAKIITLALATALAAAAQLPSTPVEDTGAFFGHTVLPELKEIAGQFNENLVFDLPACIGFARSIWMVRYRAAHPAQNAFVVSNTASFFETLFGVPALLAPDDAAFLNKHKLAIVHLADVAGDTITGMKSNG